MHAQNQIFQKGLMQTSSRDASFKRFENLWILILRYWKSEWFWCQTSHDIGMTKALVQGSHFY